MGSHVLFFIYLCSIAVIGSLASVTQEDYWKLKLPNTEMPQPIKDSLAPAGVEAIDVDTNNYKLALKVNNNGYVAVLSYNGMLPDNKQEMLAFKGINSVAAAVVFFVEEKLNVGTKMNLQFSKGVKWSIFLPRDISDKVPFSSDKVQETFRILSIDPNSKLAHKVTTRIERCEEKPTDEKVDKKCVTSLESMIDYVISKIGQNVNVFSTKVDKDLPQMEYTIERVKKLAKNDHESVGCHKVKYPYAMFFCHTTPTIRSYIVSLVAEDGTKIEAVAACHKETNDNLKTYMINVLHTTPGTTRVCHFPPADQNLMWFKTY